MEVIIKHSNEKYLCFSSGIKKEFPNYIKALDWSKNEAERLVKLKIKQSDSTQIRIYKDIQEKSINLLDNHMETSNEELKNKLLIETKVVVTALGILEY